MYGDGGLEYDEGTWGRAADDDESNWIYDGDGLEYDGGVWGWVYGEKWGSECGKASWE